MSIERRWNSYLSAVISDFEKMMTMRVFCGGDSESAFV
jgi:hypothetical protein